jgi:hypothetical protein
MEYQRTLGSARAHHQLFPAFLHFLFAESAYSRRLQITAECQGGSMERPVVMDHHQLDHNMFLIRSFEAPLLW